MKLYGNTWAIWWENIILMFSSLDASMLYNKRVRVCGIITQKRSRSSHAIPWCTKGAEKQGHTASTVHARAKLEWLAWALTQTRTCSHREWKHGRGKGVEPWFGGWRDYWETVSSRHYRTTNHELPAAVVPCSRSSPSRSQHECRSSPGPSWSIECWWPLREGKSFYFRIVALLCCLYFI